MDNKTFVAILLKLLEELRQYDNHYSTVRTTLTTFIFGVGIASAGLIYRNEGSYLSANLRLLFLVLIPSVLFFIAYRLSRFFQSRGVVCDYLQRRIEYQLAGLIFSTDSIRDLPERSRIFYRHGVREILKGESPSSYTPGYPLPKDMPQQMLEAMTVSYFVLAAVFSIFAIASTPAPEQIAKVLPPEITKALEASNVLPEKIKQLEEKLEKKEPDDMKDFLKGLKEATARGAEDQGAASKFIDKFLEGMGAKVGERAGEDLFDRVSNLLKCDGSHLVTIKGFNRDSARVPEGTEAMLSKIVKLAEKYKEASIEIQGYTDHRGDDSYNALLSKRRAEAIASLLKQKLGRTKISVFAEGKAFPRTVEGEQRDSAENRRVDVWLRCVEYAP